MRGDASVNTRRWMIAQASIQSVAASAFPASPRSYIGVDQGTVADASLRSAFPASTIRNCGMRHGRRVIICLPTNFINGPSHRRGIAGSTSFVSSEKAPMPKRRKTSRDGRVSRDVKRVTRSWRALLKLDAFSVPRPLLHPSPTIDIPLSHNPSFRAHQLSAAFLLSSSDC